MNVPVCVLCQRPLDGAERTRSVLVRGRYLCPGCAPRFELPGYHVGDRLGEIAGAERFAGEEIATGDPVELRVLKARGPLTRESIASFRERWSELRRLEHPGLVRVLEIECVPPLVAIVLERVRGQTLAARLGNARLPVSDALRVVRAVLTPLEFLHTHGVVHGDVCLANLIEAEGGSLKLDGLWPAPEPTSPETRSLVDRPPAAHLSPEQLRRPSDPDPRWDIYSVGALLYRLLAGAPAFRARTPVELYGQIVKAAPAPWPDPSAIPMVMQVLVRRALEKDPTARYASIGVVREMLEAIQGSGLD